MAKLKDILETIMPDQPRMKKLFPEGASVDQQKSKHVRFNLRKEKSAELDMDELVVEIRSDEPIDEVIHVQTIIDSIMALNGELIKKVIFNGFEITNSDLALYNSAEVRFFLIHDVEKP